VAKSALKEQLRELIDVHGQVRVKDRRPASNRTIQIHHQVLPRIVDLLWGSGFRLERAENLGTRHVEVIAHAMISAQLAPKTMQSIWTELGYWGRWIGKPGLVKPLATYLPHIDRKRLQAKTVAQQSKSWSGAGLDVIELIRKADDLDLVFGLMLRAGIAFGLRRRELLCLKPWKADRGEYLRVFPGDGPKSGRSRDIPVEHPWQRAVLNFIKERVPKTHHLGWQKKNSGSRASLRANQQRYEVLMAKLGVTREVAGVTGHGMRAEFIENAAMLAGMLPATLGGTPDQMSLDERRLIEEDVMERAGHSRTSVTAAYYGSFRCIPKQSSGAIEHARTAEVQGAEDAGHEH
jgi:integrase